MEKEYSKNEKKGMVDVPSWRAKSSDSDMSESSTGIMSESKKSPNQVKRLFFIVISVLILLTTFTLGKLYYESSQREKELDVLADNTPFNTEFTEIGSDSFTIRWETKTDTIGFIRYGETGSSVELIGQSMEDPATKKKVHEVTIDGLNPGQKYYIEIHSDAQIFGENGTYLTVRTLDL